MDQFNRFVLISLVLHLCLGLVWMVQNFLSPSSPIAYQKAIRVDVIGLPDKIDEPTSPASAVKKNDSSDQQSENKSPFEEKKNQGNEEKKSVKSEMQDKRSTLTKQKMVKNTIGTSKLSQLSALEKLEQSVAAEESRNRILKQMIFKGNAIVEGSSLTGIDKIEAEDYVGSVESHLRSFWKLPQWMANSKHRAKALVKWDTRGIPVLIQIIESSGNDEFDNIVMETIQKAVPFPEPPEKFAVLMRRQGVIFGFPE